MPPSFAFVFRIISWERVISLKGLRRFWGQLGQWTGLAPDDSLLLVRDTSSQEIYALDWQAP
jgi:hypothetical protein